MQPPTAGITKYSKMTSTLTPPARNTFRASEVQPCIHGIHDAGPWWPMQHNMKPDISHILTKKFDYRIDILCADYLAIYLQIARPKCFVVVWCCPNAAPSIKQWKPILHGRFPPLCPTLLSLTIFTIAHVCYSGKTAQGSYAEAYIFGTVMKLYQTHETRS